MKLVGMLDSPYVRRLAITMRLLGIEFEHVSQSVVAGYDTFRTINPLAKAPTLVLDDGEMMVESTLIISYVETITGRSLMPDNIDERRRALQVIGVALTGMDKVVAQIYELDMRPAEFQYEPWLQRVRDQAAEAFDWLEAAVAAIDGDGWLFGDQITQADISTAVAWRFLQAKYPGEVREHDRPAVVRFGQKAEGLPEFAACSFE
ncbi:MAG: glutathione S-transferase N-terminal domain-containing protein [Woeseiaceae bacterium]